MTLLRSPRHRTRRPTGQAGFTLLEAILALIVVSVAVLSIAGGLLAASKIDNTDNDLQRANLALGTFVENMKYVPVPPGPVCTPVGPTPVQSSEFTSTTPPTDPSHADQLMFEAMYPTVNSVVTQNPEVDSWVRDGVLFSITDVEYATPGVSPGGPGVAPGTEDFSGTCNQSWAPGTDPAFPVIRVTVSVCSIAVTNCPQSAREVDAQVVLRGNRTGN